jgi:CubicO group peptidase (beta-lactamase class C family)
MGPKSPTDPIDLDSTFILASCTKLMTSISALQCVERGLFGLDVDVSSVLPELKDIQIITGFDESTGEAIMKKAENKITLRSAVPPLYR